MSNTIEVRDLRQQDWVWTAKALLFHADVDEKMYKVYNGLAAYADNTTQQAFPSIDTLVKKLHMSKSTVLRSLGKLEELGFVSVDRIKGAHNTYALLTIPETTAKPTTDKPPDTNTETTSAKKTYSTIKPVKIARDFFKGILDLKNKTESEEAINVRAFLQELKSKYPDATKEIIWSEITKFERYWTELNQSGTKQRWEKETAFEVDRRLVTWFSKNDKFKKADFINNTRGKKVEFA